MNAVPQLARSDPGWYTPAGLPPEILAYDTPPGALRVGGAGKVGALALDLAQLDGGTRVVRQFQQLPLYIFHPLYVDPGRPGMAFIYVLQSGEGIVQGDRYRLDLHCAPGSEVHVTSQADTKIFRMEENFATQMVNLTIGANAFVEYLPDPVIPFIDSRFYQRTLLTIDHSATAILGDVLLPGRVARGEVHDYALYYTDLEARTPDGTLLFADRLQLAGQSAGSPGLLGSYTVLATLYVVSRKLSGAALADRLHGGLAGLPDVLAGASELPNGCGAAVRILGRTSAAVGAAWRLAWNDARLALLGVPAPDLRKR